MVLSFPKENFKKKFLNLIHSYFLCFDLFKCYPMFVVFKHMITNYVFFFLKDKGAD